MKEKDNATDTDETEHVTLQVFQALQHGYIRCARKRSHHSLYQFSEFDAGIGQGRLKYEGSSSSTADQTRRTKV